MKIAIVAPSGVPYTVGGAEKLWWGLLSAINQGSRHEVELIKIPSPERNLAEVVSSYQRFSELDLGHFDLIISTKYPAWMVRHPNHVVYLQHRLRGLYDMYPPNLDIDLNHDLPAEFNRLRGLLNGPADRTRLADLWPIAEELLARDKFARYLALPGPVSRAIVHYLDSVALAPAEICRYAAISHTVTERPDYFPRDAVVEVIHHPSDLSGFHNAGSSYLFTASRLDGPKRIDLLIDAFRRIDTALEFRIAGVGPDAAMLRERAAGDARIKFLGRLRDSEIVDQYASALFVPFVPYDEDYGLITVEAMASGKAVLTTRDSGGVTEFVETGVNGLVVEPDADAVAAGMRRLLADPENTRRMGQNANARVAHISWEDTVARLLDEPAETVRTAETSSRAPGPRRNKIVVLAPFPVWPPQGGGQSRVFHFYSALARYADITLLTLCSHDAAASEQVIAPNLRERRVPKSPAQQAYEAQLSDRLDAAVEDIAAIEGIERTPAYRDALLDELERADVVVASHPYLQRAIDRAGARTQWYEAHNVELDMKAAVLADALRSNGWRKRAAETAMRLTYEVESACLAFSEHVMVCSDDDAARLTALYEADSSRMVRVPNGVELTNRAFVDWGLRRRAQRMLGLDKHFLALFMGSYHQPNIEAVRQIARLAGALQEVEFALIGTVCNHAVCAALPANVRVLGLVGEREKRILLETAQLALNPVTSGSGTNLKMLDYAAAGVPILSTGFGNRGLALKPGGDVLIAELAEFESVIRLYFEHWRLDPAMRSPIKYDGYVAHIPDLVRKARLTTETHYDWNQIADHAAQALGIG